MPVDDVVDVQADVTDAADGADVSDAVDQNADGAQVDDDAQVGTDAVDGQTDDATDDADADEEGGKDPVGADGRRMPDSLKKALAAVKATSPEAAKELRGLYFANQEYRNAFPTVADATKAKEIIEEIGGPDGVQEIAAEREEWSNIDRQYAEGDPNFIKGIAESNPEAFVKIAPHAINEWAARAPEQYAYFAQSLTVNMLKNQQIPEKLAAAYDAARDNPQLQSAIAGVYNSIVDMQERAQQFAQKRPDPERERFQQEKQTFEQQRRASFEEGVAGQARGYLKEKIPGEIKIVVGNRKVDADAMALYERMVEEETGRRLAEVPGLESKLEAFYRTGDAKKSLDFVKAHYNKILPEAAKIIAPLVRNIAAAPAPKKTAAPANNGSPVRAEVTLKEMPEWKDIDMAKTQAEYGDPTAAVMSGHAILRSGKRASGWI